jgi:hypothetical protein
MGTSPKVDRILFATDFLAAFQSDDRHGAYSKAEFLFNVQDDWGCGGRTEGSSRQANFLPTSQAASVALLAKDNIAFVPTSNGGLGVAQNLNFAPRFGLAYEANSRTVQPGCLRKSCCKRNRYRSFGRIADPGHGASLSKARCFVVPANSSS